MAKTLGFIADRFIAAGYAPVVTGLDRLGDNLLRLELESPEFTTATTTPGDSFAIMVSRNDFRHYTPAILDRGTGRLTVIVGLHGNGPGEDVVLGLSVGDELPMMKWANRRNFVFDDGPAPIVVIGDATVIGLAMAFRDRIGASGRGFRAILEVPAADVAATAELVPGADVQAVGDTPGAAILTHLAAASFTDGSVFYLAGHGQSIQQQRTVLREVHSVPRKAIRTQPFWATGKVGL